MWRVERPAENSDAHDAQPSGCSRTDVAGALDQVLERAQLAQADRAAGVQLLSRVADLRAHPELAAVGEPRRRVDVHAGGIDAELERARRRRVPGDDRLGVSRAVSVDVLDRLLGASRPRRPPARARGTRSSQSSSVAASIGTPAAAARARSSPWSVDAGVAERAAARRAGTPRRRRVVHEQRLGRVAHAGRWSLALSTIASARRRDRRSRRRTRGSCPRRRRSPARSPRP